LSYVPERVDRNKIDELLSDLNSDVLVIDRSNSERSKFVKSQEFMNEIVKYEKVNNEFITLRVREVPNYELSGFSSIMDNGSVLIEYFIGAFTGTYEYDVIPSRIVVSGDGKIEYKNEIEQNFAATFCPKLMEFSKVKIKSVADLSMDMIFSINKMTHLMSEGLSEPRLEWTFNNGELMLWDLSIEKSKLISSQIEGNILSPGGFVGQPVIYKEINTLKKLCSSHTISVVPEKAFYDLQDSIVFNRTINEWKFGLKDIVIVADKPHTEFALLMKYVKGFIFEEGSQLCHLGIMLREAGVPAIFLPNAMEKLSEIVEITLMDSKLLCVNNSYEKKIMELTC
jgi:hypothetical protein